MKPANPIDALARQHTRIFAGNMVLILLGALFTYWVWRSGNRVQEAIRSDADARIEEAKAAAAQANQRAAEAQYAAEREQVERLRLEAQIAPRRLAATQQHAITQAASRFRGRAVGVVSYGMDPEGAVLAAQIIHSLREAGMNVHDARLSQMSFGGLKFGVHVTGTEEDLVDGLSAILRSDGGLVVARPTTGPTNMPQFGARVGILVG
jgi:hypothetical protein